MSVINADYLSRHGVVSDPQDVPASSPGLRLVWGDKPMDKDPNCYIYWVLGSFILSSIVHHVISPQIFGRFLPAYARLSRNKRMEWDSRVLSTLHAICVCHFALSALANDPAIWTHPVTHYSHEGFVALSIAAGYMICDLVSMPFYWGGVSLVSFFIHHIFVLIAAFLIIYFRAGAFFGVYRLLTEISTPSLNFRWFLRIIGLKSTDRAVKISTIVFLTTFFFSRYLMIPGYWYVFFSWYGSTPHMEMVKRYTYITELGIAAGLVLDILNVIWGKAVFKLAWKTCLTRQHESENEKASNKLKLKHS